MRRWDALDATPIPGTEIASYPAISPDGQELETGVVTEVTPGRYPRYTATGHLVFQGADGVLLAAPFDVRASALTGPAVPGRHWETA